MPGSAAHGQRSRGGARRAAPRSRAPLHAASLIPLDHVEAVLRFDRLAYAPHRQRERCVRERLGHLVAGELPDAPRAFLGGRVVGVLARERREVSARLRLRQHLFRALQGLRPRANDRLGCTVRPPVRHEHMLRRHTHGSRAFSGRRRGGRCRHGRCAAAAAARRRHRRRGCGRRRGARRRCRVRR